MLFQFPLYCVARFNSDRITSTVFGVCYRLCCSLQTFHACWVTLRWLLYLQALASSKFALLSFSASWPCELLLLTASLMFAGHSKQ